jgi:hypothetical protein
MPGGGFGIFNGCTSEFGTPSTGWGAQYGGISSRSQCDAFPASLKAGCYWRFDWFKNADNPAVTFKQVACPAAITAKTGCVRANDVIDETPTGPPVVGTTTVVPSTTLVTTKAPATTTASGTGGTAAKFGQCGGMGYTGPTACEAGSTCTYSNAWYSQCL